MGGDTAKALEEAERKASKASVLLSTDQAMII